MTVLFDSFDASLWPYVFILVGASLPTDMWRWLGVAFAGHLSDDSEWILLARAIANALVAGVITRLILFPTGALLDVPVWMRLVSVALSVTFFFGLWRNLLLAVFLGAACLVGLAVGFGI
ncbi:AzlD domain-containing protein [uncultured Cohaesibacter sp.]|uniref:AzlD domain-containing protein n=1 Tax=uncultured Cohaesibacter sp. TaxID=1002546 RepID=UPI0029306597|nr:AzlD domain-containing protein [uncultured Cohaesibacter sp.]